MVGQIPLTLRFVILGLVMGLFGTGCALVNGRAEVFKDCPQCPEMVRVKPGAFEMGSPENEPNRQIDEGPQHRVVISKAFAIGRFEVTRAQYAYFVVATNRPESPKCFADRSAGHGDFGWVDGLNWRHPGYEQRPRDPAVCISWTDARDYAVWLSQVTGQQYRLPSEAEWEYAARGGTAKSWWWGDDPSDSCMYANVADLSFAKVYRQSPTVKCTDGYVQTAPVGTYKPNPYGLFDVYGNAWEWVADCRNDNYVGAPNDGSAWMSGDCTQHGRRGGSWYRPTLRAAARSFLSGDGWHVNAGFRVVRELPGSTK